jgi:cytoskeletal protein CcmA (bactofilin family)
VSNPAGKYDAPGNLIIGEGVKVVGHLMVPGMAVINGVLEGGLQAGELLVGPQGSLSGQVNVRIADVHGRTFDTLSASEFLCVRSTGIVSGKAHYGEIEIEKGGVIQGNIGPVAAQDGSTHASTHASVPAALTLDSDTL